MHDGGGFWDAIVIRRRFTFVHEIGKSALTCEDVSDLVHLVRLDHP